MPQTGTWTAYAGSEALVLAAVLFIVAGALMYLGIRLHHPVGTQRPGRALGILLILIWVLALVTLAFAVGAIAIAQDQQRGTLTAAPKWACFGFSTPSSPLLIAFNAISKILSFVTAITLFLPQKRTLAVEING